MHLFWHRRDLRAADNRGLYAAAQTTAGTDAVLPVFVFDPVVLDHAAPPRVRFLLDSLAELREWYRERGAGLLLAHGDPSTVIPDLADEWDVDRVIWNHDYSGLARERDEAVRAALDEDGVAHAQYHDAVHHEPGAITTNDGDPYQVYTYFWKKWRDREKTDPYPAPAPDTLVDGDAVDSGHVDGGPADGDAVDGSLPTTDDLGFDEPAADVQSGGTEAARALLADFCDDAIYRYEDGREYPAREDTSRLSPHLKFGTIGVREVYAATEAAMGDAADEAERESVREWRSQLAWREFYTQVLDGHPEVVAENFKTYENSIDWRNDPEELRAWKEGRTGYPVVDAGMRQLREEAYVHNRVRMIVASFLTKDLLVDWRAGYAHFREHLVDHDTANDNGGWQWAASTGTDAQPYFRIFNPMTQGERYDPEADYVHEYVPELRGVDAADVHQWHDLDDERRAELAPEYPAPIVDHDERREAALAMFEAARGETE